ncbi:hypothetical protein Sste5346_008741 [Sporothrix stenoceras]|uniref:RNase H type-1 domain-containing protein n=1 Tax=Sporothrix stenoceras TaxID=5173 RepID=A0ABR3YPC8_9PEZI
MPNRAKEGYLSLRRKIRGAGAGAGAGAVNGSGDGAGAGEGTAQPELTPVQKDLALTFDVFALPKLFTPIDTTITPSELFPSGVIVVNGINEVAERQFYRFVYRLDPQAILIYTAGRIATRQSSGMSWTRGGCGHVYHGEVEASNHGDRRFENADRPHERRVLTMQLEEMGADGKGHKVTIGRAALRAALAVLQIREWTANGIKRLVIATDSEYVVKHATQSLGKWAPRNFQTGQDHDMIEDGDLWKKFWAECQFWYEQGLEIFFWHILEEQNSLARSKAVIGAQMPAVEEFGGPKSLAIQKDL